MSSWRWPFSEHRGIQLHEGHLSRPAPSMPPSDVAVPTRRSLSQRKFWVNLNVSARPGKMVVIRAFFLFEIRNSSIRDSFSRKQDPNSEAPSKRWRRSSSSSKDDPPKKNRFPFSGCCAVFPPAPSVAVCDSMLPRLSPRPCHAAHSPNPAIACGRSLPQASGLALGLEEAEDVVLTNCITLFVSTLLRVRPLPL